MSKSAKNLIVVLGIITTVFAAYYFFTQGSPLVLSTTQSDQQLQELLQEAEDYRKRQLVLNAINLDASVFQSEIFNSLRGYAPELEEFPIGRNDPFLPTQVNAVRPQAVESAVVE